MEQRLEADGRRFGVFGVTWNHPHPLPEDRRAFVHALARLGAAAMDRGRLFDAERAALRRAEAAQRRLDLLAETGRTLSASLEYEDTLLRLAGLGLPVLGDLSIVDVVGPGGQRRLVATSDPDLAGPAAVIEAHPGGPDGNDPVGRVCRAEWLNSNHTTHSYTRCGLPTQLDSCVFYPAADELPTYPRAAMRSWPVFMASASDICLVR